MTDNNDQSSDTQSDQNNSCSNERIEGPTFIDDDSCPGSCPTLENQSDNIPEGCPVPTQTTTTDSQGTSTEYSQDLKLQNNNQLQPNTLSRNRHRLSKKYLIYHLMVDFCLSEDYCNLLPKPLFLGSFFVGYVKFSNRQ